MRMLPDAMASRKDGEAIAGGTDRVASRSVLMVAFLTSEGEPSDLQAKIPLRLSTFSVLGNEGTARAIARPAVVSQLQHAHHRSPNRPSGLLLERYRQELVYSVGPRFFCGRSGRMTRLKPALRICRRSPSGWRLLWGRASTRVKFAYDTSCSKRPRASRRHASCHANRRAGSACYFKSRRCEKWLNMTWTGILLVPQQIGARPPMTLLFWTRALTR